MFTVLKNWLETVSIRSDRGLARLEGRDLRKIGRDITKVHDRSDKFFNDMKNSNNDPEVIFYNEMNKNFLGFTGIMFDEFDKTADAISAYRTLMKRDMATIVELQQLLAEHAKFLKTGYKDNGQLILNLQKELKDIENEMENQAKGFLQTMASVDNTNFSTQQLLDEASTIRDAFYQAKITRNNISDFNKNIKKFKEYVTTTNRSTTIDKELSTKEIKMLQDIKKSLHEELLRQSKFLSDAIQFIYKIQHEVDKFKKDIQKLVDTIQYPQKWQKENIAKLDFLLDKIKKWEEEELSKARLSLAQAQRIA